jgi:hypothetical protein
MARKGRRQQKSKRERSLLDIVNDPAHADLLERVRRFIRVHGRGPESYGELWSFEE